METEQINFEFVKVPKKLILNLEESYLKIKENIIKDIKKEIFEEYGIDIRNSGRSGV